MIGQQSEPEAPEAGYYVEKRRPRSGSKAKGSEI